MLFKKEQKIVGLQDSENYMEMNCPVDFLPISRN